MAREYAIPSSSTILQDYGLSVNTPSTTRNRRVVIIGTAEDGPLYEPVIIDLPTDGELVWGRQTKGDLVRGIFECWNAQQGNQNVVGVRIGNAKTSMLELVEINSTEIDEEQPNNITSLRLKGRFPGPIYDQVTINYDTGRVRAGDIALYNPKTGLYSFFTVDRKNPFNTTVDVHNVAELALAINADRNMASVITAEYDELTTDFEIAINDGTQGAVSNANSLRLDLRALIAQSGIIVQGDNAYVVQVADLPYGVDELDINGVRKNLTITNNLITLENVEAIGISNWSRQQFSGVTTILAKSTLDGKGTALWNTIQAMKDYNGDSKYMTSPSGNVVSEFLYNPDFVLTDEIPTDFKGLDQKNVFTVSIDMPFDDTESPYVNLSGSVVQKYLNGTTDPLIAANYTDYAGPSGLYADARCIGIEEIATKPIGEKRPYGAIRIWASKTVDPNGQWTELPYHPESGVYMSGFIPTSSLEDAKVVFAIGTQASGCYNSSISGFTTIGFDSGIPGVAPVKWTNLTDLINSSGFIKESTFIRVTGNTVKGIINELDSLSQLQAYIAPTPTHYFVRGQELLLNSPAPFAMIFNYGTKIAYEIGSAVSLTDPFNGQITFNDPSNLPGPGGGPLDPVIKSHIRLNYKYLPNFPAITSKAKALHGGTSGANLSVKQREDELKKAYLYLANFEGDIWVPMGAYVDAIKKDFNENTGLLQEMTTTFAADIEEFLDEQSINLYQPHAVLGTTQVEGTTLGDRDAWVTNLTVTDINNPINGANVMASIQNKFISVAAFEPIFLNTGRGAPYAANGQAAYAGVISAIPYDVSPTNKSIPGIFATRFPFTIRQLEALNGARYVTLKTSNTRPPVIVNDVTAAPYGSDYVNWSIFSITKEAADRIKRIADNYIGRPNSMEVKNALDQDISNVLKNMSGIQAFNFNISSTIEQQVLGVVEIDLVIVPVFTMKKIRTTIKLRKSLSLG